MYNAQICIKKKNNRTPKSFFREVQGRGDQKKKRKTSF